MAKKIGFGDFLTPFAGNVLFFSFFQAHGGERRRTDAF
jgi:hypothetical protein